MLHILNKRTYLIIIQLNKDFNNHTAIGCITTAVLKTARHLSQKNAREISFIENSCSIYIISILLINFKMKKFSSFSNKENLYPITKPLSKYSCYRPEKGKQTALVRSKTNRQSNTGIFMGHRFIDFPEISAKRQNKSTRRKVHTQTRQSDTSRKCKDMINSIFKREKHQSIEKELQRLESLHTINRTLRKELDSLETIVLNMSLKKLVRADLQANSQEIYKRRC